MTYNLYIQTQLKTYNILNLDEESLEVVINAYNNGHPTFTIGGKKHFIRDLLNIKIFTYEVKDSSLSEFLNYLSNSRKGYFNKRLKYITPAGLSKGGKNVTYEFLGNSEYGNKSQTNNHGAFVDQQRIEELIRINSEEFDLSKLIRLLNELNDNYSNNNFLSVGMIGRAILDHIPPVFKKETFADVANQYPGKSFQGSAKHLQNSLRHISDNFLHQMIRSKEILPTKTQVDFSQSLDVILAEIVRILK